MPAVGDFVKLPDFSLTALSQNASVCLLEVNGRLAFLVDTCLDTEFSRRNEWFYFSHMNTKIGYYYRRKIASVFASVFAFTFVSAPGPQCP